MIVGNVIWADASHEWEGRLTTFRMDEPPIIEQYHRAALFVSAMEGNQNEHSDLHHSSRKK